MLLEINNLTVEYITKKRRVKAVRDCSFMLDRGTALGIVGESGCGKSTLALSILRCVPYPGLITGGTIVFEGLIF